MILKSPNFQNPMSESISITRIKNSAELEAAFAVREKVFVEEQKVPRLEEYDAYEDEAHHYLATYEGVPCGAARWRTTPKGVKLERFAVLKEFRGRGVGGKILEEVLADVQAAHPDQTIYLHAQVTALPFYQRYGFSARGAMFSECDIDHYLMVWVGER
jgi:predicted GNAT family N-acyltransferase